MGVISRITRISYCRQEKTCGCVATGHGNFFGLLNFQPAALNIFLICYLKFKYYGHFNHSKIVHSNAYLNLLKGKYLQWQTAPYCGNLKLSIPKKHDSRRFWTFLMSVTFFWRKLIEIIISSCFQRIPSHKEAIWEWFCFACLKTKICLNISF